MELKPLNKSKDNPSLVSQSIALTFIEFGTYYSGQALSTVFVIPCFTRLEINFFIIP